jgi:hypothetical protein
VKVVYSSFKVSFNLNCPGVINPKIHESVKGNIYSTIPLVESDDNPLRLLML